MTAVLAPPRPATREPFAFVGAGHPLAATVVSFRDQVAADPDAAAWLQDPTTVVHAEVKARRLRGGDFAPERMYLSLQRPGEPFAAISHCWSAADGRIRRHVYPDDPRLPHLAALLGPGGLRAAGAEVLRYVPLRRVTVAGELPGRPGRRVVAKVKREARFRAAHERAVALARATVRSDAPFAIPAPLGVAPRLHASLQAAAPGTALSELATAGPALERTMARAGALQHAFHLLPARGLPVWDRDVFRAAIDRDLAWVAFAAPGAADVARSARAALGRCAPATAAVCCHGDWVPSHLLAGEATTTVIDLDLARWADPVWEVGMALAALARDVPVLAAAAADPAADVDAWLTWAHMAWLAGRDAAGAPAPDPRALRYWLLAGESYELALMVTKDRCAPVPFARALARVAGLAERVGEEGA